MKDIKEGSWPDLDDWKELFEAITTGIVVIDSNSLSIKRYNNSAEKIFRQELESGKMITGIDHGLVYEELVSDLNQIQKNHKAIKRIISPQNGIWFVVGVEVYHSSKEKVANLVLSFVDITELMAELEHKVEVERQLQREILEVEKKERWRLGQFLHDTAAQNLLSIKMILDLIEPELQQLNDETRMELEKIKRVVIKTENNLRELSRSVLPIEDEGDILSAFQKLVTKTTDIYGVECVFEAENGTKKIEGVSSVSLYYITQEAIQNAIHHGQADKIEVTLSCEKKSLALTIKDNGVGYDESAETEGMGLNIMRHRAELLGGTLEVKKMPDSRGTIVTCRIPLET